MGIYYSTTHELNLSLIVITIIVVAISIIIVNSFTVFVILNKE